MTRTRVAALAAVTFIVVVGFFAGRALHPTPSSASAFDLTSDAYRASSTIAGLSKAGFSGFTEAGPEGRTVISGRVVQVSSTSITLEGQGGQRTTLSISGQGSPLRLEPASRDALKPGVTVIVRRGLDPGAIAAVLIVSTD